MPAISSSTAVPPCARSSFPGFELTAPVNLYRTIIADGVSIPAGEHYENAAIVRAEMVRASAEIPEKALKGYIQGDNYVVPLN